MKKILSVGLVACALAVTQSAFAQDQAALVRAGAAVYAEYCSPCHGENLNNPGWSPDLVELGADERPLFDEMVTNGKGEMPGWGGVLKREQFDQIWAYIRSKSKK